MNLGRYVQSNLPISSIQSMSLLAFCLSCDQQLSGTVSFSREGFFRILYSVGVSMPLKMVSKETFTPFPLILQNKSQHCFSFALSNFGSAFSFSFASFKSDSVVSLLAINSAEEFLLVGVFAATTLGWTETDIWSSFLMSFTLGESRGSVSFSSSSKLKKKIKKKRY